MDETRQYIVSAPHKMLMAVCLAMTLDDRLAGAMDRLFAHLITFGEEEQCSRDGLRQLQDEHPHVKDLADCLRGIDLRDGTQLSDSGPAEPPAQSSTSLPPGFTNRSSSFAKLSS